MESELLNKKKWFILGFCGLVIFTLIIQAFVSSRSVQQKGTWIWDASSIVVQGRESLAFAEQQGVTKIYLYIDQRVAPQDYARFIQEARRNEIQVEALGGDPSWGRKDKRPYIKEFTDWVSSYNTNVTEEERFSGIHLDIEPYLLPEWKNDRKRVVEEWLSNMDFVARDVQLLGDLDVSVDLPFWVHLIEVPGYDDYFVSTWMLKRFDTVVLMDYRNQAEGEDGIISNALAVLTEASTMENKSVIVGVEMAKSSEGDQVSFFEKGHQVMMRELAITQENLNRYSAFEGVAIHGFSEWMASYHR